MGSFENEIWFTNNVICGKKRPHKKFRLLYEVRYQAGVLIGEKFGSYKNFEKLRKRMRKFLNLIYEQSETLKKPRNGSLPNKVYLKQVNVVISRPGPAGVFFEKVPALFFTVVVWIR